MKHLIVCALAGFSLVLTACGQAATTDQDSTITKPMSGNWAGTGSATIGSGSSTPCQTMGITLTFTATDVTVSNVAASCTGTNVTATNLTLQYTGAILYYGGTAVGNITDSSISANVNISGIADQLDVNLTDATHITFTESASGSGQSFSMAGTLTLQ